MNPLLFTRFCNFAVLHRSEGPAQVFLLILIKNWQNTHIQGMCSEVLSDLLKRLSFDIIYTSIFDRIVIPSLKALKSQVWRSINSQVVYWNCRFVMIQDCILLSCILCEHIAYFYKFSSCVPKHIVHQFSEGMSKKSEVVCECTMSYSIV